VPAGGLELVADFSGLGPPDWSMPGIFAYQSVGYFMQDDLLNFPKVAVFDQVTTDGNSSCPKVTLAGAVNGPVETKGVVDQAMLNKKFMRQVNCF